MKIGVLALQGDFERHQSKLNELGSDNLQVRKPSDLENCDGLIIPGGESTTLVKLLKESGLYAHISSFAEKYPVFGTCAGLILLSSEVVSHPLPTLNLLDISVQRNAYGRQINSFSDTVDLKLSGRPQKIEGVFIRAPKIARIGEGVKVLGYHRDDVVIVEKHHILASTFHPELSDSTIIHRYFLSKAKK